ncbi:MAG: methyltransferase domain-containing protein [Chloroflexota bacterium]
MLHVAPELMLENRFRKIPHLDYLSADLSNPRAMVRMDITDIRLPEHSFDVIYGSHVLEHVPDDRRAMREFRRVLKPGGWALFIVPITAETTFEDPAASTPEKRLHLFGQADHVRRYGPDFQQRLEEAGFVVTRIDAAKLVSPPEADRLGLGTGVLFFCRIAP